MKMLCRWLALALCLCLAGAPALAAGLERPEDYLGAWQGGEDYGEAGEYYLYLNSLEDGVFTLDFDIYRIWSFSAMTAALSEERPTAVFSTNEFDEYTLIGALDFSEDAIEMFVLESDYPDLPANTVIRFARADFE